MGTWHENFSESHLLVALFIMRTILWVARGSVVPMLLGGPNTHKTSS